MKPKLLKVPVHDYADAWVKKNLTYVYVNPAHIALVEERVVKKPVLDASYEDQPPPGTYRYPAVVTEVEGVILTLFSGKEVSTYLQLDELRELMDFVE